MLQCTMYRAQVQYQPFKLRKWLALKASNRDRLRRTAGLRSSFIPAGIARKTQLLPAPSDALPFHLLNGQTLFIPISEHAIHPVLTNTQADIIDLG